MRRYHDDFLCFMDGRPLNNHASRGEYRSLLLSFKLLELKFFEETAQQKPILLLDDVFSELDFSRQEMLLQAIEQHQTIITATHLDDFITQRSALNYQVNRLK